MHAHIRGKYCPWKLAKMGCCNATIVFERRYVEKHKEGITSFHLCYVGYVQENASTILCMWEMDMFLFLKIHVMMSHDLPCNRHNWWIWCIWLCEYPLNVLHKKYEQGWMKGYVHNMIKSPKIRNVWSWVIELLSMWQVHLWFSYHKLIKFEMQKRTICWKIYAKRIELGLLFGIWFTIMS